jgi:hypothetical protein
MPAAARYWIYSDKETQIRSFCLSNRKKRNNNYRLIANSEVCYFEKTLGIDWKIDEEKGNRATESGKERWSHNPISQRLHNEHVVLSDINNICFDPSPFHT